MQQLNLFSILILLHVVSSRFLLINTIDKDADGVDYGVEKWSRGGGGRSNRIIAPGLWGRWGDYIEMYEGEDYIEKRPGRRGRGGRDYMSYDYDSFYPVRLFNINKKSFKEIVFNHVELLHNGVPS